MTSSTDQGVPERGAGYAFFVSFVAALGGFLFGYDLVIISGAQLFIRAQFALSPVQFGFATSSALLGCIAGPSLGAWMCDRLGRKTTLLFSGVLFAVGAIGSGAASTMLAFNLFRVLGGIGVGLSSLASPMYIAEIGPPKRRGQLGLMYQLAITIGALAATIVSYFLAKYVSGAMSWRLMLASVVVPVVLFIILLLRVPQSPRWLAQEGRYDEAFKVLAKIDGADFAKAESDEIRASLTAETGEWRELFQPGLRRALLTGILLALFNNWTGWSGIAYYVPTIFQQAGFTAASDAILQNVVLMAGAVLLTVVSIWFVDRSGRRPLWLVTSAAMFFCLVLAGLVFHLHITGTAVVVVIFLILAAHSVGLGPLPWLMMSELYPTRIRARAVSISTTFVWVAGFTGPVAFPTIQDMSTKALGSVAGMFWFYAAICLVAFFWALKYLPETKGRTLEEIGGSWTVPPGRKQCWWRRHGGDHPASLGGNGFVGGAR